MFLVRQEYRILKMEERTQEERKKELLTALDDFKKEKELRELELKLKEQRRQESFLWRCWEYFKKF